MSYFNILHIIYLSFLILIEMNVYQYFSLLPVLVFLSTFDFHVFLCPWHFFDVNFLTLYHLYSNPSRKNNNFNFGQLHNVFHVCIFEIY